MEFKDLAPWLAIAFTLALSILVPLFTQIANNRHQRKMQQERYIYEDKQRRIAAFEAFLSAVGGIVTAEGFIRPGDSNIYAEAGSAIHNLYVYAPEEWFDDLDLLQSYISESDWRNARVLLQKIDRLISDKLREETEK